MLTPRGAMAAVLGCGLLGLDLALFAGFYTAPAGWPWLLAAHLALGFVTALPDLRRGRSGWTARLQLVAWMLPLGPFGVLIGLTLLLPKAHAPASPAQRVAVAEDDAELTPGRLEILCNDLVDGRLRLGGGHLVRPLLDVVIEGETAEKLVALSLIAKCYVPGFAPVLQRALGDEDSSVRVLAATVVAQLHNGHTRRIGALQDTVQAAPAADAWRALGEARLAYGSSGLLEADRAKRETEEGHHCLTQARVFKHVQAPGQSAGGHATSDAQAAVCIVG